MRKRSIFSSHTGTIFFPFEPPTLFAGTGSDIMPTIVGESVLTMSFLTI